jgi:ribosome-binding factor A
MSQRTQRLAEQIQRDLAQLIRTELKDPRLGMITVSGAKVSPDLGYADIYVTVLATDLDAKPDESLAILNSASGFLRGSLSKMIQTRITPRLRFHYDEATARGNRMAALIHQALREDNAAQAADSVASAE